MLHGILNCYKPVGKTSRDVVNVIERRLRPAKVGHAGTLDPLAEGVLVVAVGAASRLVPYLHLYSKIYRATFRLGCESASGDLECELVQHPQCPEPSLDQLHEAAARLTGSIQQIPPMYSAVKIGGRRAYKAARASESLALRSRTVQVHRYAIGEYAFPELAAEIECGTGTYIRTLGIDLAAQVGTRAVMTSLVRSAIGPFRSEDSLSVEAIAEGADLRPHLAPLAAGTEMLGKIQLDAEEVAEIEHGRAIRRGWASEGQSPLGDWAGIDPQGRLRCILIPRGEGWGPKRVFPPSVDPAA